MAPVRILIVEDSLTVRRRLTEALARDPGCVVVGEATDGESAFELCQRLRPDVVTLDLVLPRADGLEVTERIMASCPTPIVVLTSAENRLTGLRTVDVLAAGAVDAVDKPALHAREEWDQALVSRIKLAARVRVVTRLRGRVRSPALPPAPPAVPAGLVALGASTGGPAALRGILRGLSPRYPLPILLVMHLSERFDLAMADWLNGQSALPVRYAVDGELLPAPGQPGVLMAPANRHLAIRGGRLRLTDEPERHSCRPSVDVLFESVAREIGPAAVGCLLTGMGSDGAAGLAAMRREGATTLVQDEATSTVFGMPRAAIRLGAASHVIPLSDMAPWLEALARPRTTRGWV